ncbi:MAG TPA: TonB-dependent receptor, partial [Longimicrobiales bacterium]|nr:TonB-dependent receptor [Longimicrobiales bacterium]
DNPIPNTIIDLERWAAGSRLLLRGGADAGFRWALGVDAALQRDGRRNFENLEGTRGPLTLDQDERVTNTAIHARTLLPLGDRVSAFGAVRLDRVVFSAQDHFVDGDPDDSGSRTMQAVSPAVGLSVDVAGVALYGNVSTSFETPTTTELVNRPDGAGGFNRELEPQRTVSVELGGRATRGRLGVEGSVYHARVTDGLVPFEVATAPGRTYFRNAAVTIHRGLELQGRYTGSASELVAAYSRTLAEFSSYATDEQTYDGRTVPGVRPWVLEVRASGRLAGAVVEADYQATGRMPVDDANQVHAPGYDLVSLRASFPFRTGRFWLRPYAGLDNVLDESHVASVVPNAFGGRYFEPGPGRTFFVGLEARLEGNRQGQGRLRSAAAEVSSRRSRRYRCPPAARPPASPGTTRPSRLSGPGLPYRRDPGRCGSSKAGGPRR